MINAIFRPIDKWPSEKTAADKRRRSPFKAAYNATLDLLEAELQHLYASDIVIQCEAQRSQIRNDGWLKSDARVEGPAVIVSFNSRKKSYGYPCDRFTDWKANLRAIALSLEALRAVDRYGVTTHGQQYQGFLRLAAAESRAERNPALEALAQLSGVSARCTPVSGSWRSGGTDAETLPLLRLHRKPRVLRPRDGNDVLLGDGRELLVLCRVG
jgi:hypothetical protein